SHAVTSIEAVSTAELNADAPPPPSRANVPPLRPAVRSHAWNVTAGSTTPTKSAAGTKRMRVRRLAASSSAEEALTFLTPHQLCPPSSENCHLPCAAST